MPEKFRIEISPAAMQDVSDIWNQIAIDAPAAAMRFIQELQRQLETLETYPNRCPKIPEEINSAVTYRHLIYGNYRTIFSVRKQTVYIARIIHGARLMPPP